MNKNLKLVFFGAGVIGGSVGGWIAKHHEPVSFLDQGPVQAALREKGITLYRQGARDQAETVKVKVIADLAQVPDADVVVLAVKNYSLPRAAELIKSKIGDRAVIVSLANGIENQRVLPKYFSRVIYCVVSYNAWSDEPGVIGYQKKGPLILGTLENDLQEKMAAVAAIFNRGVETLLTPRLQDAVHSKIVLNLANSLTTLIGFRFRELGDPALFQKLMTRLLFEGIQIIKAAGYRECRLGGMPSWLVIWTGAHLPRIISRPLFEANVKKMVVSSMAQDVIQRRGHDTELESINGYIISLADRYHLPAPVNRAVYELARREFAKPNFEPLDLPTVWKKVEEMRDRAGALK